MQHYGSISGGTFLARLFIALVWLLHSYIFITLWLYVFYILGRLHRARYIYFRLIQFQFSFDLYASGHIYSVLTIASPVGAVVAAVGLIVGGPNAEIAATGALRHLRLHNLCNSQCNAVETWAICACFL